MGIISSQQRSICESFESRNDDYHMEEIDNLNCESIPCGMENQEQYLNNVYDFSKFTGRSGYVPNQIGPGLSTSGVYPGSGFNYPNLVQYNHVQSNLNDYHRSIYTAAGSTDDEDVSREDCVPCSNFGFTFSKSRTRCYWQNYYPAFSYYRTNVILPRIPVREFCFVQFWLVHSSSVTSELGLRKRKHEEVFIPLSFNTDDDYKTAYFGDKYVEFEDEPRSLPRSKTVTDLELEPGELVRMVLGTSNIEADLWINREHVTNIKLAGPIREYGFGFETDVSYVHDELLMTRPVIRFDD